jgi:hypothetical protein
VATSTLTNTACANATCFKETSVLKLHDGGGLYLWIFPNGKKYWRLRYRQAGKEKLVALVVYPRNILTTAPQMLLHPLAWPAVPLPSLV